MKSLKKWIQALATLASLSVFASGTVGSFAATPSSSLNHHGSTVSNHPIVALGDSISYGYNLGNNKAPSPLAFPELLGSAYHLPVVNLSHPGWTTTDVLGLLSSASAKASLKSAALVTLDIGSNDLIQATEPILKEAETGQPITVTPQDEETAQAAIINANKNLLRIVAEIRMDTKAPIVLLNLYNPFPATPGQTTLHSVTAQLEAPLNLWIAHVALGPHIVLVNANQVFAGKQASLILPLDIHPTAQGQSLLAKAILQAVKKTPWIHLK